MKQALAVVGALALIIGAVLIRDRLAGDDAGASSDGPAKDRDLSRPTIACTPDLQAVCDELVARKQIRAATDDLDLDAATSPPDDVDGWITWSPAPAIADIRADQGGNSPPWGAATGFASSPQAVLAVPGATDQLATGPCDRITEDSWTCFSYAADAGLGIGVGDPATAEGIARLAPLARGISDYDDPNPDDLYASQVRALVDSARGGQADAATMARRLATAPGTVDLVVGPTGVLEQAAGTSAGKARRLRVVPTAERAEQAVVVAPRRGRSFDASDWCRSIEAAIERSGLGSCGGTADDRLAGFLYQVQEKVD